MDTSEKPRTWINVLAATAVLLVVGIALRFGTGVRGLDLEWDEPWMLPVVVTLAEEGWSVETAIDYEDTKGPTFFWLHGLVAEIGGTDVQVHRIATLVLWILAGIPIGLLATRCGLGVGVTVLVATLFALLPYNVVLGQLFMSEPSFMLGSLLLVVIFVWGFGETPERERRIAGPVLFGLGVAVLLHHRPHVVAFAAAVLVASLRDGARSWPWWAACAFAGLLRLPLYLRWGGLVSPEYHDRLGLGLRLDSLTYLSIALLPCTVVFLWSIFADPERRTARRAVGGAAIVGLLLGLLAVPDLSLEADAGKPRYMGIIASTMRMIDAAVVQRAMWAGLAALGFAAVVATGVVTFTTKEPRRVVMDRLAGATLVLGWMMYAVTRGALFDRYALPFIALLPFVYPGRLPRWLIAIHALVLAGIAVKLVGGWLF
jgi:hypothetical protein